MSELQRVAYRVGEVATMLGVKPVRVQRWLLAGELPGAKVGGTWFVAADELQRVLLRRFLEAARGDRYEALYVTAAATGLRQGELLGLAWSDVDLDRATVSVALQLQRRGGRYVRVPLKSAGESHVIDVPAIAVEALRAHRERQSVRPLDDGLVFVTERGRPVSASVVTHGLGRIAKAAGLPRRDFHGLRRFRASLGSALRIDPKVTQGQLGHANIATTLGIYTYTTDEQGRAAAALVDAALREAR